MGADTGAVPAVLTCPRRGWCTGPVPCTIDANGPHGALRRRADARIAHEPAHTMKIALVGFAGSGKTTVFNTMTGLDVPVGFGGEARLGTVRVPDPRIDTLSAIFKPRKTTYAEMTFQDIPGEHGAEKKGLSRRALQQIRDQEALCLVLRDFANPALEGAADPVTDLEAFIAECVLADLEVVERRLDRARREKANPAEVAAFELMKQVLEEERPLRTLSPVELNRDLLRGYALLTDKPLLVALNVTEDRAAEALPEALAVRLGEIGAAGLVLSASMEAEIAGLAPDDQAAFLADLGLEQPALHRFIRTAYALLDLISFFTVGPDEVRAWTIRRGTRARQAAGRIHSDLERGFIRAEVTPYEVFMQYGSEQAVKDAGRLQVEGKDYVVADGDILSIRFNV
jgi:ribosome-binding ATPase